MWILERRFLYFEKYQKYEKYQKVRKYESVKIPKNQEHFWLSVKIPIFLNKIYFLRVVQTQANLIPKFMSERVGSDKHRLWNSIFTFQIDLESINDDLQSNLGPFNVGSDSFRHWFRK